VAGETNGSLGGPFAGGLRDAFLARYDADGNRLWIRQFGTTQSDGASALAPDDAGGMFVGGWTAGNLGGPHSGLADAFVARYDADGNQIWITQFGTGSDDPVWALAPDGAGGVMVAGHTRGSLGGPNAGIEDAFLARYDVAGNRLWIRQFGTNRQDRARALAPDGAGGVFVAGETNGSLGGPFAGGLRDAFLARYDADGNRLWIRQFGNDGTEWASALAPDGVGGVMVAGLTNGSLVGGPPAPLGDAFLARYDGEGNQIWIRQFGTIERDCAPALASDGAGGVIVGGSTKGSLGGPNTGDADAYLARYDAEGNQRWIHQFGTTLDDQVTALGPDGQGGVAVAGTTRGSLGGPNAGDIDAFVARFTVDSCYADCNKTAGPRVLDLFDFLCFQDSFVNREPYACDCDISTGPIVCDIFDFLCFQNAFVAGCP
ncbi:MAG: SBBP repeat-containing protein, partial [Planctomycetes bacterium]|nr:SBBP repeat-containing protein [Planctomycetota bacterium]